MIAFSKPSFGQEEVLAATRVLQSGQMALGENVKRFEEEFAAFIGAPHVVATDSCTSALFLSLKRYYTRRVGCPSMTFASVAAMITEAGHELRFTDEYHAGFAYNLEGANIWDCAHELKPYEKGQIQCYSFYPNKVLGSAKGGAIATDNEDFADWARLARNNGRLGASFWNYSIEFPAWNMYMNNLQAEILREQLKKADVFLGKRKLIRDHYNDILGLNVTSVYLYILQVPNRKRFMEEMAEEGIETSVHYRPLHLQPAYLGSAFLPETEKIASRVVSIPLYPAMTPEEIRYVANTTKAVLERTK